MFNDKDILERMNQIQNYANEIVHKVHSFIEYGGETTYETNDLIILNVYQTKYVEMVVYKF